MKDKDLPLVSIIIPCRNEEKFIGKCLDSILVQDYPKDKLEVLVINGMSEDGTKEIVKEYNRRHVFIRLLDNPKKTTPCALNIGIKHARGEIIMRMDARATYEKDYISKRVRCLGECNADNVGGLMITKPRNNTFIGNSTFRTASKEPKWVDTVFDGCYRKEVFEKIGLFNEALLRGQGREFQ